MTFRQRLIQYFVRIHAKSIEHNDIKPHNLVMKKNNIKVIDFDLAEVGHQCHGMDSCAISQNLKDTLSLWCVKVAEDYISSMYINKFYRCSQTKEFCHGEKQADMRCGWHSEPDQFHMGSVAGVIPGILSSWRWRPTSSAHLKQWTHKGKFGWRRSYTLQLLK